MEISPIVGLACGFAGSVSGAASGARHPFLFAVAGGCLGLVLGIGSFWALVFPYVCWLIEYEKRHPPTAMYKQPRLWVYLFLPLMISTLVLAALMPWFVMGLLT